MNLSHVITEFSFGPFFPDISQPLDNTFEVAPADSRELFFSYTLSAFSEVGVLSIHGIPILFTRRTYDLRFPFLNLARLA